MPFGLWCPLLYAYSTRSYRFDTLRKPECECENSNHFWLLLRNIETSLPFLITSLVMNFFLVQFIAMDVSWSYQTWYFQTQIYPMILKYSTFSLCLSRYGFCYFILSNLALVVVCACCILKSSSFCRLCCFTLAKFVMCSLLMTVKLKP